MASSDYLDNTASMRLAPHCTLKVTSGISLVDTSASADFFGNYNGDINIVFLEYFAYSVRSLPTKLVTRERPHPKAKTNAISVKRYQHEQLSR
jgi:hypothetical protein